MSTRVYYRPRDIEVDLSDLPRWLYDEIASLHGQIDRQASPLTCMGNGEPMYVWRTHEGRYFARHYAHQNADGHSHRIATMSDEHRRQTDYARRAADDHGLATAVEFSTGNHTRLDLAVTGAHRVGFEIQRSQLSRRNAELRAFRSFEAGWPTAWVSDAVRTPEWHDRVPSARLTKGIDWTSLPARNSARVIIGKFTRERDRTRPSGWRYVREPRTVMLDELAYLMPAGEIVPVATGTRGVVSLATADAREVIDSCTYPGASAWRPSATTPRTKETAQRISRDCHHADERLPAANSRPDDCLRCGHGRKWHSPTGWYVAEGFCCAVCWYRGAGA